MIACLRAKRKAKMKGDHEEMKAEMKASYTKMTARLEA
jgi:hypothetical protein